MKIKTLSISKHLLLPEIRKSFFCRISTVILNRHLKDIQEQVALYNDQKLPWCSYQKTKNQKNAK